MITFSPVCCLIQCLCRRFLVKNSSVHKFLHKAFTGTHDDFQIILSSLLLKMPVRSEDKLLLDGIEISATAADATVTVCTASACVFGWCLANWLVAHNKKVGGRHQGTR